MSPNERLQLLFHPWTSYVIVPLFALANAGIVIDGDFLSSAYGSPVTLGIVVAYVVGKPVGILGDILADDELTRGRAPTGRLGRGRRARRSAGIGFTVSLLIATIAFTASSWSRPSSGC